MLIRGVRSFSLMVSALVLLSTLFAATAQAGGYDTPILYSARHMGMGGTAVSYVNDPSSLFHNPAGLAGVKRFTLMGNFSPLVGTVTGSPSNQALSEESTTTFAPMFLLGGAAPVNDWLSVGFAVYPVASAGATYEYNGITDKTTLVFLEASPGIGIQLPENIRLGLGYRITYASVARERNAGIGDPNNDDDDVSALDFTLTGFNFFSFRAGLQWAPIDEGTAVNRRFLSLGVSYRHKTEVDTSVDSGSALGLSLEDLDGTFTLPSRVTFGLRVDSGRFGFSTDFEYGFNSQNEATRLNATIAGVGIDASLDNVFLWKDAMTLRAGAEARLLEDGQLALRLGYIFDGITANRAYPTAFGTPPAPTQVFTLGGGYQAEDWQLNLAYAYRFGQTQVSQSEVDAGDAVRDCVLCGEGGEYAMNLHGFYIDFSYGF